MEKAQSKHLDGSIFCGLLTAFGIVTTVMSVVGGKWVFGDCCALMLLSLIVYYAFIGYKKPHGNLLKYIVLLRAAVLLINLPNLIQLNNMLLVILQAIEIGLSCYVAGRLAKAKENLILRQYRTMQLRHLPDKMCPNLVTFS